MGIHRVDWIVAFLVLAMVAPVGCGSNSLPGMVPIRGEVYCDGKPLEDGFVVYLPKQAGVGRQATGPIKPDGSFVLTTQKNGDGVMDGAYYVVIYEDTAPAGEYKSREEYEAALKQKRSSVVPQRYANQFTSGLNDTVDANHSGFKRFDLTKK